MNLGHYDDKKEKFQSHEVFISDTSSFYNGCDFFVNHNPCEVRGYGETKEVAIEEFTRKFDYILGELQKFRETMIENIVECDYDGTIKEEES